MLGMKTARAAVQTADETLRYRDLAVPDELAPDEALLRIEGSGMCGSDVKQYMGELNDTGYVTYPVVPGHEPVGVLERVGDRAKERWGVSEGDRVAVEPAVPCGICDYCLGGRYQLCENRFTYGYTPTTEEHGLWGGYAEFMMLRPNSILHPVPENLSVEDAVLFNPLGAGFEWAYYRAGTEVGDTVLILGPGQRGLASVIACNEAGAGRIIVTGLERDERNLELAEAFGADATINVERTDTVERVKALTDGGLADQVIDTTPSATQPVVDAIDAVKPGGTVALAGFKGNEVVPDFNSDQIVLKDLDVHGSLGVYSRSYEQAIRVIESGEYPLEKMHTHTLPIDDLKYAIRLLRGEADEPAIHVTAVPD